MSVPAPSGAPLRVLHVLGSLQPGGVEMWLLAALESCRGHVETVVCTLGDSPGSLDEKFRRAGAEIVRCPLRRDPLAFSCRFVALLRERRVDVVHSHVYLFSGLILALASRAGVPARVAHSHTALKDRPGRHARLLYRTLMSCLLRRSATLRLAASTAAGQALYGSSRFEVLHYGIDLGPYAEPPEPLARGDLGISSDGPVVGHVGRLVPAKNQEFLLFVWREFLRLEPTARLILVGDGPLGPALHGLAAALDLGSTVLFLGARLDVPRLMTGSFDAFVLPSCWEGLPVAALEAQAAGLPVLVSDAVSDEICVVPALVRFLPLGRGHSEWARALQSLVRETPRPPREASLTAMRASRFDAQVSGSRLLEYYRQSTGRDRA